MDLGAPEGLTASCRTLGFIKPAQIFLDGFHAEIVAKNTEPSLWLSAETGDFCLELLLQSWLFPAELVQPVGAEPEGSGIRQPRRVWAEETQVELEASEDAQDRLGKKREGEADTVYQEPVADRRSQATQEDLQGSSSSVETSQEVENVHRPGLISICSNSKGATT